MSLSPRSRVWDYPQMRLLQIACRITWWCSGWGRGVQGAARHGEWKAEHRPSSWGHLFGEDHQSSCVLLGNADCWADFLDSLDKLLPTQGQKWGPAIWLHEKTLYNSLSYLNKWTTEGGNEVLRNCRCCSAN